MTNQKHISDVAIVIVNWNTKQMLRECLLSIREETSAYNYEVYVVDNNSPDLSADMVRSEFPRVHLIANKENFGFAPANNQALRIADARYYLLLNPDTVVKDGAIDKMVEFMDRSDAGIVTCKLLNDDGSLQKSVNNFFSLTSSLFENRFFNSVFSKLNLKGNRFMSYWDHSEQREIDWAYGAVLMFSHEVYEKVGLLDERFYIYAEEMDFYMRARKAGFKAVFLPDVKIIHYGKSSSRQRRAEMFIQNYKSFYLFLKKHYPAHVYLIYRARTMIYLHLWLVYFGIGYISSKISKKYTEEFQIQFNVYLDTIRWHFGKNRITNHV